MARVGCLLSNGDRLQGWSVLSERLGVRGKAATPGFFGAEDGTFTPTVYSMGSGWAFGSSSASWTPIADDFDNDGEIDSGLLLKQRQQKFHGQSVLGGRDRVRAMWPSAALFFP